MTTENSANSAFGSTSERPYTLRKRVRGDPGLPITTNRRRVVFNRHLSGECRLYPFFDVAHLGFARVAMKGIGLLAGFFGLGVILTAIDHALASGESGRSGLGSAAEL